MEQLNEVAAAIDEAVEIEEKIAAYKERLEMLKMKIQTALHAKMRDKNLNYAYINSNKGRAELLVRTKLDIVNYDKVMELLGDVAADNITVKTEPKYEMRTRYKIALTALLKLDYEDIDLPSLLRAMGANSDTEKVLLKKLKGEYKKDLELLTAAGLCNGGDMEEELDAIRSAKNAELIRKYFRLDKLDVDELAKVISVEDTLALTINSTQ